MFLPSQLAALLGFYCNNPSNIVTPKGIMTRTIFPTKGFYTKDEREKADRWALAEANVRRFRKQALKELDKLRSMGNYHPIHKSVNTPTLTHYGKRTRLRKGGSAGISCPSQGQSGTETSPPAG